MKKLVMFFLSLCLILCSNFSLSVLAQDSEIETSAEVVMINGMEVDKSLASNYKEGDFEVVPSKQRITAAGDFSFEVRFYVDSNSFKVSQSTVTIQVGASIINPNGDNVSANYPGHRYKVELCKDNFWKTVVGSDEFDANGDLNSFTLTGLSTETSYFLRITNVDELPAGTYVTGSGYVSHIASIEE